uniref:Uncharacterized protein n=1 Tax=Hyaloperonospora arabidopsidis (strain Emoy2) TaxID=559515 RepID=M4BRE7_HYAAE
MDTRYLSIFNQGKRQLLIHYICFSLFINLKAFVLLPLRVYCKQGRYNDASSIFCVVCRFLCENVALSISSGPFGLIINMCHGHVISYE